MNSGPYLMVAGIFLIIFGAIMTYTESNNEQYWLSECAQHRPLADCREDYNVLKRSQP